MNEHSQSTWQQRALKGGGPVSGLFVAGLETEQEGPIFCMALSCSKEFDIFPELVGSSDRLDLCKEVTN